MAECIHGLEVPLCDICYPKAPVDRPRASAVRTTATASRASRAPASAGTTTTSRRPRQAISVATQRVYHVTHIRNLEAILTSGELLARVVPVVDVSTPLARELRATAEVSSGQSVGDFVSFYLSPAATNWHELRDGAADVTRWSPEARAASPTDFVFLVTTVAALGASAVITDGDAAASLTRFASGEGVQRMLERVHDHPEFTVNAEALVKDSFAFAGVQLIGVANDRARDRVRETLAANGGATSAPKVAVYPPWFQV